MGIKEIEMKKKELVHAKKEKLDVKLLLSKDLELLSSKNIDPEDLVYQQRLKKSAEQMKACNEIIKDIQNEIKWKETAIKEIDEIAIDINDNKSEIQQNGEGMKYNFSRKKGKSIAMRRKQKKESNQKSRATVEGKEKNRDTAKKGMSKLRETDDGKDKHRLDEKNRNAEKRKTDEGKENNRDTAKKGMSKLRETDDGRDKHRLDEKNRN